MSDFKLHSIGVKPGLQLIKTTGKECSQCKEIHYAVCNHGLICTNCSMVYPKSFDDIEKPKKVTV